jgi:ADP-dependent NAD(P)H-hydrate dehydratase / NAD(P)H-hydrate epimerase
MMKILTAAQTKEADLVTIQNEPISAINLMERASRICVEKILGLITDEIDFINVVCGKGNNGGDGLAIARLLSDHFRKNKNEIFVNVFIIEHSKKSSADFDVNLNRLDKTGKIGVVTIHENAIEQFATSIEGTKHSALIIDAIFGYGLNKEVDGIAGEVIDVINKSGIAVIAIDLPSGLYPDTATRGKNKHIIRASLTLTFQFPKLAFMMAENGEYYGDFIPLDIKMNPEYISSASSSNYYIQRENIHPLFLNRKKFSHKGTFGHALLLAGSYGKMGAAVLSARAVLKSGAGLLTTHIPGCGVQIMQTSLPEAMVSADENENLISNLRTAQIFNAIGIGPGIGTEQESASVLKLLIQNFAGPLVIDADALNILSENKTWLGFLKPLTILTPHPKEFDRLAGAHTSDFDRFESAKDFAAKYNVLLILKGAHTAIITPNKTTYFNSTGNPAMAKGGSGDVLTGILTGLLTRGYSPLSAALLGVYAHGLAADLALSQSHEESLLASEIIENIPAAFNNINENKTAGNF